MKCIPALALVFIGSLAMTGDAQAKRYRFWGWETTSDGKPTVAALPTVFGSAVLVRELPHLPQFTYEREHYDLGYKFGGLWGGEWIGYYQVSRRYVELHDQVWVEETLLPALGMSVADTPQRTPKQMLIMWLMRLAIAGSILTFIVRKMTKNLKSHRTYY